MPKADCGMGERGWGKLGPSLQRCHQRFISSGSLRSYALGAFCKNEEGHIKKITTRAAPKDGLTVVSSRSNREGEKNLLVNYKVKNIINLGSSLKICLIAAGEADLYPRYGPTSEWDIAAGHAILTAAGGSLTQIDGSPFLYGKDTISNPSFIAQG